MRRPPRTREQRDYDKRTRALRQLERMAVRFALSDDEPDSMALATADLAAAAQRYALTLGRRELRRMAK